MAKSVDPEYGTFIPMRSANVYRSALTGQWVVDSGDADEDAERQRQHRQSDLGATSAVAPA